MAEQKRKNKSSKPEATETNTTMDVAKVAANLVLSWPLKKVSHNF